jgi:HD-like signal output (HDOD) protein
MNHTIAPFMKHSKGNINLPSLSKNINRLLTNLNDTELNHQKLAEIVMMFPEISTRLIYLANSAWTSPARPVTSIEQACLILGHSIVKSISFGISISSCFDTRKCPGFKVDRFWTTAILVSKGAGLLASRLSNKVEFYDFEQTLQSAGLIHNIGLLWLADNLPKETDQALQKLSTESTLTVNEALIQHTGTDYCEVGSWLCNQLRLPEVLRVAIKYQLDSHYQKSFWEIALLVGAAAGMVTAVYNQSDDILENVHLNKLGLDYSAQSIIFKQLADNFEKTQNLVRTMFA